MFLKISQKGSVTFEYHSINGSVTVKTINDGDFDTSEVVAHAVFDGREVTIFKNQNAWLVNDEGKVLEVINRDYIWSGANHADSDLPKGRGR